MRKLAYTLLLIPIVLITLRVISGDEPDPGVLSDVTHKITFQHHIKGGKPFSATLPLPQENIRQKITIHTDHTKAAGITNENGNSTQRLAWRGIAADDSVLTYTFTAKTKHVEYEINPDLLLESTISVSDAPHLIASATVQSNHPAILEASAVILDESPVRVRDVAVNLFEYVEQISSIDQVNQQDALSCYQTDVCTEEGKSRLLTAMFRAAGIPARMVGGLILSDSKKSILNYWMQARIGSEWVTFDPERGHFAELPASHLELFTGDNSLYSASFEDSASYFAVEQVRQNEYTDYALFNIWNLIDEDQLPLRPVMVLLLLPLGAYIVAICTNVVGFKTYGVFLPVLIAFAFIDMGLVHGLIFFSVIIGLISLMSFPLERWGILHTPKIVCLLTAVGIYCLAAVKIFYITGWVAPSATLTFPIIILTLIAERFAQKVEEESLLDALTIYGQTLIVTLICYWILSATVIQHAFITFPELLIGIAGLSLLLGKWIGLQLFEYSRFSKIDEEVSYAK